MSDGSGFIVSTSLGCNTNVPQFKGRTSTLVDPLVSSIMRMMVTMIFLLLMVARAVAPTGTPWSKDSLPLEPTSPNCLSEVVAGAEWNVGAECSVAVLSKKLCECFSVKRIKGSSSSLTRMSGIGQSGG